MAFLDVRTFDLGPAPEAIVARLSFTGEAGYEIYVPMQYQRQLFETLARISIEHGGKLAGGRALMDLRLEKSFPAWGLELTHDYGPVETGLGRFVDWQKSDFIGREAAQAARDAVPSEVLTTLVVGAIDADCTGGEPVLCDGAYAGYVSSGGFGHFVGESLALAYIRPEVNGSPLEVMLAGQSRPARISPKPRFDPDGERMRA